MDYSPSSSKSSSSVSYDLSNLDFSLLSSFGDVSLDPDSDLGLVNFTGLMMSAMKNEVNLPPFGADGA